MNLRRVALVVVLGACRSSAGSAPNTQTGVPGPGLVSTAPLAASATLAAMPSASAHASSPVHADAGAGSSRCKLSQAPVTLEDKMGTGSADGTERLENLRVARNGESTYVSWERQSDYQAGDSWRTPWVAARKGATSAFDFRAFPVRAFACATYGHVGVASTDMPMVTWGQNNFNLFQLWRALPTVAGPEGMEQVTTPAARSVYTSGHTMAAFAASGTWALASVYDTPCDPACQCQSTGRGVWLYPLDGSKKTRKKVAALRVEEAKSAVPALAMGSRGGLAVFRDERVLWLSFVSSDGDVSAPLKLESGDVGAPAVAVSGDRAVVVWAQRESKDAPYALRLLEVSLAERRLGAAVTLPRLGSAFAPAMLLEEGRGLLSWMEGDGSASGAIYAAEWRTGMTSLGEALRISDTAEANARDPELGGSVARATLVYATFSKARPGGNVRLAEVVCDP